MNMTFSRDSDDSLLVEDEEALEYLQLMLIRDSTSDLVVQLVVRKDLDCLESLVRQGRPRTMSRREIE